jgi:hypothetical protein
VGLNDSCSAIRGLGQVREPPHEGSAAHTRWLLLAILSTTAGAVDVIGFLTLGGLLTAHATGNLAIQAAHYVTDGFSRVGPLLAVPVFVAVLGVVALAFLAGCLGLGTWFGPFADADRPMAVRLPITVPNSAIPNALAIAAAPRDETRAPFASPRLG